EEDAVCERVDEVGRDLQGEACLACAARPRERQQARLLTRQQASRRLQFVLTAEQGSELGRQVVRGQVERRQGAGLLGRVRYDDLIDVLRAAQVAQAVLAQIPEARPFGEALTG